MSKHRSGLQASPDAREIHFFNSGPSGATIKSIHYGIRLVDDPADRAVDWLTEQEFRNILQAEKFRDCTDFDLRSIGQIHLPPHQKEEDAELIAAFSADAVLRIWAFNVRVRFCDEVDNEYERVLCAVQSLDETGTEKEPVYKKRIRERRAALKRENKRSN